MSNDWKSFVAALQGVSPPPHYPLLLRALWIEAKGDWAKAHDLVDDLTTLEGAWVHAYLHRVEGDVSNADYWYRRAKRNRPTCSLEEERKTLVEYFLKND